jgi:hypothetical protein
MLYGIPKDFKLTGTNDSSTIRRAADHIYPFRVRLVRLLARGDYEEAASWLDEPNSYNEQWSAERIKSVLEEYCRSTNVNVSNPDTVAEIRKPSLVQLEDESGYSFAQDVPLNGRWSDLTAQFEFLRQGEQFKVILQDIHVL